MVHDFSLLREEHLVFLAVIVTVVAATLAWIVATIAGQCRHWRESRQVLAFKREMVERGLSVEQVERLLAATQPTLLARLLSSLVHATSRLLAAFGGMLRRTITACQWGSVQRQRQQLEFKARLIERGLSVAEVERLYEAEAPSWPVQLGVAIQSAIGHLCAACRNLGRKFGPLATH